MLATDARQFYLAFGIEAIPLKPGTKWPLADAWPTKPIADQWRNAPGGANVGIRHRGDVLNIDADNKSISHTSEYVFNGLVGLGITTTPIVQTASGSGRAFYLRCDDTPQDTAFFKLAPSIGAGELRIGNGRGAMSVLPPSRVDGRAYTLIAGDWHALPIVQWRDLLWLLPLQRVVTSADVLPVRLIYRYAPRGTAELFAQIAKAPRACGHYADAGRHADAYLATTYANGLAAVMSKDTRQALAVDYGAADALPWPGKTGNSDKAVYLAVLSECYRAGAIETSASVRELAEHAAVGRMTAQRSLKRLAHDGRIKRIAAASQDGTTAAVWRIITPLAEMGQETQIRSCPISASPAPTVTSVPFPPEVAELASRAALGKSAVSVYRQLDTFTAATIPDLAQRSGRARSTVRLALVRLARYGLAILTDGGGWLAGPSDLATVARELDCIGLGDIRRARHAHERAKYQAWIALRKEAGRNHDTQDDQRDT